MSLCLTHEDLIELTHKKRSSAQRRALNFMGIDYKIRPDGTVAVFRELSSNKVKTRKPTEPNLSAIN